MSAREMERYPDPIEGWARPAFMQEEVSETMSKPFKCPVCNGCGHVPTGFYSNATGGGTSNTTAPDTCRTCHGSGVIWEPEAVSVPFMQEVKDPGTVAPYCRISVTAKDGETVWIGADGAFLQVTPT
jgi:hypothetical protein